MSLKPKTLGRGGDERRHSMERKRSVEQNRGERMTDMRQVSAFKSYR
jgi:hypothetical protein